MPNETAKFKVGNTVRQESDDGSMGTAKIIAIAMDKAWCFYATANCHRVQSLKRLELIGGSANAASKRAVAILPDGL